MVAACLSSYPETQLPKYEHLFITSQLLLSGIQKWLCSVLCQSLIGQQRTRSVLNKLMSYSTVGGSMGFSAELFECPHNMAAPKRLLGFMTYSQKPCSKTSATSRDPHNGTNTRGQSHQTPSWRLIPQHCLDRL